MKTYDEPGQKIPNVSELVAVLAWRLSFGKSDTSAWRYCKAGLLGPVYNVFGKPYITRAGIAEFERRAKAGEFHRAPRGIAGATGKLSRPADRSSKRACYRGKAK